MIEWERTSKEDIQLITGIFERAIREGIVRDDFDDRAGMLMDLEAAHIAEPLDLAQMLIGDNNELSHDIWGIYHHLNRQTGQLDDGFVPRFAKSNSLTAVQ